MWSPSTPHLVGRRLPAEAQRPTTRQRQCCAGRVRESDPQGWLFHIDGDEVLHLDKQRLLGLADDVEAVLLSPLEALAQWEWPDDDVTVFKRLLAVEELNLLHLLGRLERPDNHAYFRGHTVGKAGMRVSTDAWLDIHRVVDDSRTPVAAHRAPWLQVLHYESHTLEEFVRKWSNHLTSGHRLVARSERRRLASAMQAEGWKEWPAELADQVRRELFAATALDDREGLERLGLLVTPVLPQRPTGPVPSDPHLDGSRSSSPPSRAPTRQASGSPTPPRRRVTSRPRRRLRPRPCRADPPVLAADLPLDSFEHLFDDGQMSSARSVAALDEQRSGRAVEQLRARVAAMEHKRAGEPVPTLPGLTDIVPMHAGSTYAVDSASLALALAAGASRAGEWVGFAGCADFGAEAAAELGIELSRTVLVPDPGEHWLEVTAALVDVLRVVVLRPPGVGHRAGRGRPRLAPADPLRGAGRPRRRGRGRPRG